MKNEISRPFAARILWPAMQWAAGLLFATTVQAVTIPGAPLQTVTSAEPNIMMLLDDSGSMHWEALPDDAVYVYYMFPRATGIYGGTDYQNLTIDTDQANQYVRFLRSSNNKVYYNPTVYYRPWSKSDGSLWLNAVPTAAFHNPALPAKGSRNLTIDNTQNATWLNNNGSTSTVNRTFYPATYFSYNGGNVWNAGSYTKIEIKLANAPFTKTAGRTDCAGATCTYTEEMQNFANWYTYYRSRILTARAGIGRSFASQGTKLRAGFGTINQASTSIDGTNTRTVVKGVRLFTGTDRTNFFDELYNYVMEPANTPLRRALDDVGKYYSRTDDLGPWSSTPGVAGGTKLECRQSYTIMMTDGYWNDAAASGNATLDNDSTNGPTISGPNNPNFTFSAVSPFRDGRSNTLADVAMYYWKRDLNTLVANKVPTNVRDPAFWQHMVTFGVGLGVQGSVDPVAAFAAISSGATITWPNPVTNAALLDDLVHASVNGRGGFFSAQNPDQFATALGKVLEDIVNRSGSASSLAANSTQLIANSKLFSAHYDTSKWSGELLAFEITQAGVTATPQWTASQKFPVTRSIFTTSGGAPAAFTWASLSSGDKTALGTTDVLDYIRGVRSKEKQNGGTLRNRSSILGDIVNSSPVYVGDTDTVYVGANDGMLHAFNATTGAEQFAYIPSTIIAALPLLTDSNYSHQYFVDGDIAVSTRTQTPNKNYLVANLGRGGKGLFGLDVTNPATFGTANVLWEYTSAVDADLGYMLGRPLIAKMNDGSTAIIVSNGYNSTNGKAVLYIFNLATGALIKKIDTLVAGDNGLATPGIVDSNNDGTIDAIYAGDLKGNVWKFDVSSNTVATWDVATKVAGVPQPMFVARDALNIRQPITAPITVAIDSVVGDLNYGKRFVFFGTGSFFQTNDPTDLQIQTWYGLIDDNATIASRTDLKARPLVDAGTFNGFPVRTFSEAVTNDMVGKKGWYIDLKVPALPAAGERIVTGSRLYNLAEPTLIASSIIPIVDPCVPGGEGYINAISPFSGTRLTLGFFDLNGNTNFGDDKLNGAFIGSVNLGAGMPSEPVIIGNRLAVGGSGLKTGDAPPSVKINTGKRKTGRMSWREITRD